MSVKIPHAIQEVWDWEEQIYRGTKKMSLKEYAQYIKSQAKEIREKGMKSKPGAQERKANERVARW